MSTTVSSTARTGANALFAHHPTGVSTGVFDESRGVWERLVAEACGVSTFAVELSALSEEELPGLIAYLATGPRLPFRYVSVHAPIKDRKLDDAASARALGDLPLWVRSTVTHPDTLHELAPYRELGTRLVLENMVTARPRDALRTSWSSSSTSCLVQAFALTWRTSIRSIQRWPPVTSCLTDSARDCARCT